MTIREATVADMDALIAMAMRFIDTSPVYSKLIRPSPAKLAGVVHACLSMGAIFVAEVDDTVVGMLAVVALEHLFSDDRYVDEIVWWVEPRYRLGTIGPRLLMRGTAWAKEQGVRFIKMVAPAGTDVGEFYERCGYQAIETAYVRVI